MFFKKSIFLLIVFSLIATLSAKELKVLMIGNSFSICVGKFLPQIVNAEKKHKLILTSAYIGGCPLEKHYKKLLEAEKDPKVTPYKVTVWNSESDPANGESVQGNVNELLKKNQYDIITIQQSSTKSFDYSTFEPFVSEFVKYIRKYQKNAEIVIHQTWAYRVDAPNFKKWGFDQNGMYERVSGAYRKLAENYKLRVIPMADAVQNFRADSPVKYQPIDKSVVYKEPALPSFDGDVVGVSLWQTNRKTRQRYVHHDYSHLNTKGHYMQAALWYAFLFDEDANNIKFIPPKFTAEDAKLLRSCAQKALINYQQVKK